MCVKKKFPLFLLLSFCNLIRKASRTEISEIEWRRKVRGKY